MFLPLRTDHFPGLSMEMDPKTGFQVPVRLPIHRLRTSDACVVIYSVTDRASFSAARDALDEMASLVPPVAIPVLLLANKTDLKHLRKVIQMTVCTAEM